MNLLRSGFENMSFQNDPIPIYFCLLCNSAKMQVLIQNTDVTSSQAFITFSIC